MAIREAQHWYCSFLYPRIDPINSHPATHFDCGVIHVLSLLAISRVPRAELLTLALTDAPRA